MKEKIKIICSNCGKEPHKDNKSSNDNWSIYNLQEPCVYCGGKIEIKVIKNSKS